jgi:hypothetical protein
MTEHSLASENAGVVLAEVARVLAGFDWEHGDPQLALDEIASIVTGA